MAKWSNHFISFLANSFKKGQIATLPNPSLTGITKLRDIYTLPLSLVVFLLLSLPLFLLPIRINLQTGRCCALPLSSEPWRLDWRATGCWVAVRSAPALALSRPRWLTLDSHISWIKDVNWQSSRSFKLWNSFDWIVSSKCLIRIIIICDISHVKQNRIICSGEVTLS